VRIADRGVSSLERSTGRIISIGEVEDLFIRHFCDVFAREAVHRIDCSVTSQPDPAHPG
jgi:hypothetical protein